MHGTVAKRGALAARRSGHWAIGGLWRGIDIIHALWRDHLSRHTLPLIATLALALRFALLPIAGIYTADEIFQYLEPAHRIVTGYGIVTWEWREGIRSWFLPLVFSGPIALSQWLWPGSLHYLTIIRAGLVIASLSVVLSFFALGNRISRFHGLLAAFVAAIWFELVFFSTHSLSEPIAVALIMPAAVVLCRPDRAGFRGRLIAGFLLGLAIIVRFQYIPAVGLLVALTCGIRLREAWLPVALGGVAALALSAAVDLAFGTQPFLWMFRNVSANIVVGRSAQYGVEPPLYYVGHIMLYHWQSSAILLLALAAVAVRYYPALFCAAVINLLVHSLIGHKELRFLYLTMTILTLLFSLGLADLLRYLGRELGDRSRFLLVGGALAWLTVVSVTLAGGEKFRYGWTPYLTELRAMKSARGIADMCGLGLYDLTFYGTGGYTHLNRSVPIYLIDPSKDSVPLSRAAPSFNVVIAPHKAASLLPRGFVRKDCFDPQDVFDGGTKQRTCVYRRPGNCAPGAPEINRTMAARGQ